MISMREPIIPTSELVDYLRCPDPECRRAVNFWNLDSVDFRAEFGCQHPRCHQKWWAMYLSAGAVLPQLRAVVGDERAEELARTYGLPETLVEPKFWQLALTGNQSHRRREERLAGRTVDKIPKLRRLA